MELDANTIAATGFAVAAVIGAIALLIHEIKD